jgi:hypothetical protein
MNKLSVILMNKKMKTKLFILHKFKEFLRRIIITKHNKLCNLKKLRQIMIIKIIFTKEKNLQLVCAKKRLR